MNTFKNSLEYRNILKIIQQENILNDAASFMCYVDGMFDYKLIKHGKNYNFTIVVAEENFVRDQEIEWLLDLNTVSYFSFRFNDIEIVFNVNKHVN